MKHVSSITCVQIKTLDPNLRIKNKIDTIDLCKIMGGKSVLSQKLVRLTFIVYSLSHYPT